jgi:Phosphotransferase enzyme family
VTREVPAVTHEVFLDPARGVVTKRFRSWDRGEAEREWRALCLLAEYAPGLAATPLRASLTGRPPVIEMSWLPGRPLGGGPPSPEQAEGLAVALNRLWDAVPADRLREAAPAGPLADAAPAGRQRDAAPAGPLGDAVSAGWQCAPGSPEPNPVVLTGMVQEMLVAGPGLAGEDAGGQEPGGTPLARRAYAVGSAWFGRGGLDWVLNSFGRTDTPRHGGADVVLGQGDANLANFLWDGQRVRLVDFEDSGPSERAFEVAVLAEHISVWSDSGMDTEAFVDRLGLPAAVLARLREYRRLSALFWLIMLLPGGPASHRNPPGTLDRQANRLLALLG